MQRFQMLQAQFLPLINNRMISRKIAFEDTTCNQERPIF